MQEIKRILEGEGQKSTYNAFGNIYRFHIKSKVKYWLYIILLLLVVTLMLPWTQNIRAKGSVTTRRQEQRPQELNTIIAGRIQKWYVKEGDFVKKGDTLVQLSEVKDAYLDPELLERVKEQLEAKTSSISSYSQKVAASESQLQAIQQTKLYKMQQLANKMKQLQLKVMSDSMELNSVNIDFRIAEEQLRRQKIMRDSGLSSLLQLEQRNQSYQSALAKKTVSETKFANTKTDLINVEIELSQIEQEYAEKLFKVQSDRAGAQSEIATGKGEIAKLSNQYANYVIRAGQYYLLAPQDGQVTNAYKSGINEIVKEGEKLLEIVPEHIDYAVEMYVRPVDLPLLSRGQKVRLQFDGYPAIVFSGWPQSSYGMFSGRIVAIENSLSENSKFRILVAEDEQDRKWPPTLRMGTGVAAIALLKDVQIWYELWRNINGFPPEYYKKTTKDVATKK